MNSARPRAAGASRIVLDNTYVSRASRAVVIQAAAARRLGFQLRPARDFFTDVGEKPDS